SAPASACLVTVAATSIMPISQSARSKPQAQRIARWVASEKRGSRLEIEFMGVPLEGPLDTYIAGHESGAQSAAQFGPTILIGVADADSGFERETGGDTDRS